MWCLVGVTVGTAIGVLPGLGPALTIALLLPLTYKVDATSAFILFAGIYYGAMYGGSTTSILLNTPGETATIVTSLEGNKMARRGRAGAALATAAIGSFVAGTIGTVGITFLAEPVVNFALRFGPAEYFSLMVLAFVTVSAVLGSSAVRGLTSLAVGIFLGLIGIDLQTGPGALHVRPRRAARRHQRHRGGRGPVRRRRDALPRLLQAAGRGRGARRQGLRVDDARGLGALVEAVAARLGHRISHRGDAGGRRRGADLPVLFRREAAGRKPEEFGNGAIEGVAGPEAANNACAAGVLVPMLALGLPTSATAAIMLSAFQSYGITPGPMLLQQQSALVWGLIASLYIANVMLLVLNLPLVGLWVKMLKIPEPLLYGGILVLATIGTYGISQSLVDLVLLYAMGVMGLLMRLFDFPTAPVIIGMILGPLAEQEFRRAMTISQGDLMVFVQKPLSLTLLLLALLAVLGPLLWRLGATGTARRGCGAVRRRRSSWVRLGGVLSGPDPVG